MATFSVTSATTTTITVTVGGLATGYRFNRDFTWYLNGTKKGQSLGITPDNASVSYTYTGLSPGTSYNLHVDIYKGNTPDNLLASFDVSGQTQAAQLESFKWSYAGCTATGTPVSGTKKSNSYRVYVTAAEWNRLVDRVNSTKGTSISHVNSGAYISASVVNKVADALGAPRATAGNYISASFFNNLADRA